LNYISTLHQVNLIEKYDQVTQLKKEHLLEQEPCIGTLKVQSITLVDLTIKETE